MVRRITKKSIQKQKGIEICSFCATIKQTGHFLQYEDFLFVFLFYAYKLTLTLMSNIFDIHKVSYAYICVKYN